jgi:hypothetical protein
MGITCRFYCFAHTPGGSAVASSQLHGDQAARAETTRMAALPDAGSMAAAMAAQQREGRFIAAAHHSLSSLRALYFAFADVSASIAADALSVPSGCFFASTMTFEPWVSLVCVGAIAVTETFDGTVIV